MNRLTKFIFLSNLLRKMKNPFFWEGLSPVETSTSNDEPGEEFEEFEETESYIIPLFTPPSVNEGFLATLPSPFTSPSDKINETGTPIGVLYRAPSRRTKF